MSEKKIQVSIVCTTYNQRKYIRKALDSFMMQKTDFPFEILVHDDCSTDGTTEILREYEKRYPTLIRALYEEENQYSKYGLGCMKSICYPKAWGKYIAPCEGDDYFTDEKKLQIQYDYMESHPEISMCACQGIVVSPDGEEIVGAIRPAQEDGILTPQETILGGGMFLATNSLFFRKELFMYEMEYEKVISFDYTMQIKGAMCGGIYYFDRPMAAYRRNAEGSWSVDVAKFPEHRKAHIDREIAMLRELDQETEWQYHDAIEQRLPAYVPPLVQLRNCREELITRLNAMNRPLFVWGLGVRGNTIQEFCREEGITIDGVCDQKATNFGECNAYGTKVFSTEYVLKYATGIVATNDSIAKYLKAQGFKGEICELEPYILF